MKPPNQNHGEKNVQRTPWIGESTWETFRTMMAVSGFTSAYPMTFLPRCSWLASIVQWLRIVLSETQPDRCLMTLPPDGGNFERAQRWFFQNGTLLIRSKELGKTAGSVPPSRPSTIHPWVHLRSRCADGSLLSCFMTLCELQSDWRNTAHDEYVQDVQDSLYWWTVPPLFWREADDPQRRPVLGKLIERGTPDFRCQK
jgi:hypothetical protein